MDITNLTLHEALSILRGGQQLTFIFVNGKLRQVNRVYEIKFLNNGAELITFEHLTLYDRKRDGNLPK